MSLQRLGVMGGTFDPIHTGHLVTAAAAQHAFELDRVLFVPAGTPWQKSHREVAPAEDRYLMTVIATAADPSFAVSRIEIDAPGPTYTVDTLRALRSAFEGTELFFITGADAILQILSWKDARVALELATFVAATRPGHDLANLDELPGGLGATVRRFEIPALAISSTDVRARVRDGRPIRYLVPDGVAMHIDRARLYR
jgi:nicotinate-nucleotide adenylyltransferase